jgi:hypothetical protein
MTSFWGSKVLANATPSEICMPHRLKITQVTLDGQGAEKLKVGQRVQVWATQKRRGQRGAREGCKVLLGCLEAGKLETLPCALDIEKSTLVSFSISPANSCSVHLTGFFDSRYEKEPETGRQLTWEEIKQILHAQAEQSGEDMGFTAGGGGANARAELGDEDDEDDEDFEGVEEEEDDSDDEEEEEDEEDDEEDGEGEVRSPLKKIAPSSPTKGVLKSPDDKKAASPDSHVRWSDGQAAPAQKPGGKVTAVGTVKAANAAKDPAPAVKAASTSKTATQKPAATPKSAAAAAPKAVAKTTSDKKRPAEASSPDGKVAKKAKKGEKSKSAGSVVVAKPKTKRHGQGFVTTDTAIGKGSFCKSGTKVSVEVSEGKRKENVEFTVGLRQVSEAMDKAVIGMREGGVRTVVVPRVMNESKAAVPNFKKKADLTLTVTLKKCSAL